CTSINQTGSKNLELLLTQHTRPKTIHTVEMPVVSKRTVKRKDKRIKDKYRYSDLFKCYRCIQGFALSEKQVSICYRRDFNTTLDGIKTNYHKLFTIRGFHR